MIELAWNYLAQVGSSTNPACQPPTTVSLEKTHEQTMLLSKEVVCYLAKSTEPQSPVGIRMRKWVDLLDAEHRVHFANMISALNVCKENAVETLLNAASRLFEQEADCSWGRVATLFTFAGLIARKLTPDGNEEEFLEKFSTAIGNYLVETISESIFKQGGWDTLEPTTTTNLFGKAFFCLGLAAAYMYTL